MLMGFTIKCENCGNESLFNDGGYYGDPHVNKTKNISITFGPVLDDGADIACAKCKQEILINYIE